MNLNKELVRNVELLVCIFDFLTISAIIDILTGFWAPELIMGFIDINIAYKIDIFSCGVTLYRMLCNEMPFGLFEKWKLKIEPLTNKKKYDLCLI